MTTEQQRFRSLMGRLVTGITVVAADTPAGVSAMTANAVTSVSLEPLIMLVCVRNESRMLPVLLAQRRFSINVLSAAQEQVSRHYGGRQLEACPASWGRDDDGIPVLEGANATFACDLDHTQQVGDHTVVYARVRSMAGGDAAAPALVYAAGRYADLPLAA
jgi:flavin reductase (DIM6/NTAB) family NADH-FMN oxidoreductase RutF